MVSRPLNVGSEKGANDSQRERLIAGLADAIAEKGYQRTKISDVTRHAALSRSAFYNHFGGKEDALRAAFELLEQRMHDLIEHEVEEAPDWPSGVEAGIAAMLSFIESEPNYAKLFFKEFFAVPVSDELLEDALLSLTPFLDEARIDCPAETLERLPATLRETLAGGLFWIVYQNIRGGRIAGMELLLPTLVEFVLTPYIGQEAVEERASGRNGTTKASAGSLERLLFDASQIRARHPVASVSANELIRADRDR